MVQVNVPDIFFKSNITFFNFWKSRRYILALLTCLGFLNGYACRTNLSVAVVEMAQLKNVTLQNGTVIQEREFDLDSKLQGYILSSFFYGYITTQIIGGYIASRLGPVSIYGIGIAVTSFLTLITPFVAKLNIYLLIVVRILEGVCEGVTYPACNGFYAKWTPPLERTRMVTIAWSGGYLGAVLAMPLSSVLATSLGWESIFYFFGGLGLFWYIFWLLYARDEPSKDKRITEDELTYITKSINASSPSSSKATDFPIRHIVTSLPLWATSMAFFSEFWGFYTLLTSLPNFMKYVLHFDLNAAGLLSGAPYLVMAIIVQIAGQIGDWLLNKRLLSRTNTRKVFVVFGFCCQAIFLLIITIWMSPVITSICLTMAVGLGAFAMAGFAVTPLDLAPRYGGLNMGYCNTFGALAGILSPILVGYIVTDNTNVHQWRIVFYISAGVYAAGAIFYSIFGSSDVQPWGQDPDISTKAQREESSESKPQTKSDNYKRY